VKNRLDRLTPPDLVIWDEGHHTAAAGWRKVRDWADKAKHVGLSATPCRLDGKGLDDLFNAMVPGPAVSWLIENKFLSDYRAYAPSTPDLSGVHTRAGDYAAGELDAAMNKAAMIGEYPRHYLTYARGMRAVYFATSVATSERIAAMFRDAGVHAQHIDGTTPSAKPMPGASRSAKSRCSPTRRCSAKGMTWRHRPASTCQLIASVSAGQPKAWRSTSSRSAAGCVCPRASVTPSFLIMPAIS
jgi:hypothetical protein